jgi:hypothetical protein
MPPEAFAGMLLLTSTTSITVEQKGDDDNDDDGGGRQHVPETASDHARLEAAAAAVDLEATVVVSLESAKAWDVCVQARAEAPP